MVMNERKPNPVEALAEALTKFPTWPPTVEEGAETILAALPKDWRLMHVEHPEHSDQPATQDVHAACRDNEDALRQNMLDLLEDADKARADLLAQVEQLRAALVEAREDVASWGAYASEYFQEKWDLAEDLARIDAALSVTTEKTS